MKINARRSSSCYIFLILLLGAIFAEPAQAQDPAGYWKFDEGLGIRSSDVSGNGHTALLSGKVKWVPGISGSAISANAADRDFVSIPAVDVSASNAVTIAFWAKRTYSSAGGVLFEATPDYQNSATGFALFPDDETCHGIQIALQGNVGKTANCYSQPSSDVWHHLAVVFDKSQTGGNAITFYVDGVLQNPNWTAAAATNTNNFGKNPLYLFARAGSSQFTSGIIDDLQIYDGSLSAEQIQGIYNEGGQGTPSGVIAYVQGNYATPQGRQTTVSVTYNAAQAAGDLNVVAVGWNDSTATVRSVTDSKGNTYTRAVGPTTQSGLASQSIYYAKNIVAAPAGTNSVKVTFSTGAVSPDIRILEYGGADRSNPVDVTAASSGNGSTSSSGSATTTNAKDLIFGANLVQTLTSGPGSGFTSRMLTQPDGDIAEDRMVTTAGSYSATAPLNPSGAWIMQMVAFRASSSQPVLVSIAVTPTNPSITVGGQLQFTATGTYSDGSHQDLTDSATWTSSVPSVATISSTGLASGVAVGTTTIKAASSTIYGTTNLTVTNLAGNFTISASPASLSIPQGNQGTSRVTTAISGGFNSSISLSATGTPTGATVSFSPNPIPAPGAGNSTMTVVVGSSTPTGVYSIVVTGTGGGTQQSTTVTLTVTPGSARINYVQGNYATPQGAQTTVSVLFNAAQVAGDLNVVVVGWNDSTATVSSVTDSVGNTYTRAVGPTIQSGLASQSIYYAKNIASAPAGANTVTVTFAGGAVSPDIRILEYSGADQNNPVDVTAANSGNGSMGSSGSATTTSPTDLIFGANLVQTVTSGPGSGFTSRMLTQPDGDIAEDQAVTTTGNYSATAPMTAGAWIMQMVAFRTPSSLPVLISIAVTPANPSITVGGRQQFTATGTYSDGSHQNLTNSATWTSSVTSVATVSSGGLATGVAAGTTVIQAASGSIHGTTNLTVTGSGGFTISASPASLTIAQGNQGTSTITTAVSGGFNSSITLTASGLPSGTTVGFNPATIPAPGSGNSIMTITVGSGTVAGTYPITVTGNGGGVQQSATVSLTVTAAANFSISASPSSLTVMQGYQGTSTITTTISGGFSGAISLSASGAPAGATVTFVPSTIQAPGAGTSMMTIAVGMTTRMGTYPITITGTSGGTQHTATVNLTVTAEIMLTWTASGSPGVAGYNAYRSTTSGGPYTKINTGLITVTNYNDTAVQNGYTYYYVTTAVNNQGMESSYSNQSSASLP